MVSSSQTAYSVRGLNYNANIESYYGLNIIKNLKLII